MLLMGEEKVWLRDGGGVTSQILAVPSALAEINRWPSLENERR
jgi:hypothetical protein